MADVKAGAEKPKTEEAEVNAYMEAENSGIEAPSEADRRAYLWKRYRETVDLYVALQLQKEECVGVKSESLMNSLTAHFRDNYKARRWIVTELRKMGEKVDDKFVPLSQTT